MKITIARECGCYGDEVGQVLADRLNVPLYNKKTLIALNYVVKMMKALGLEIVAEGVETREMVDELKRLNCEMGQGYYFSRPIPIHEFEQKFDKNQKQVVNA